MVLNILAFLFIVGITFMHSIFGLFSGLIDVFCAIVAMVVAFGCIDAVNELVVGQGLHPAYSLPVCFILLFAVTHIVLRVAADNLIRGNIRLPRMLDWVGGGICGFIIAQITVGMMLLGILMLPWGGRVMMFSRYERVEAVSPEADQVEFAHNSIWFMPDEFTVGLFKLLSAGSLKHKTPFASVYPDYAEWVFWSGNTVQHESTPSAYNDDQAKGFGARGLSVVTWWEPKGAVSGEYRRMLPTQQESQPRVEPRDYRLDPSGATRLIAIRLSLKQGAADREKGSAFHRFRPSMVRLVGDVNGEPRHYIPRIVGGAAPGTDELRIADLDHNFVVPAGGDVPLDVYFEVDRDFTPRFVEYRRFARAAITGEAAASGPDDKLFAGAFQTDNLPRVIGGMRFIDAIIPDGTGDLVELPIPLLRSALSSVEVRDGKFLGGRIAGPVSRFTGSGQTVTEFALPEGMRLFQLRCHARSASTIAGHVFNFVGSTLNQYRAFDDQAGEYRLCGYYGIVTQNGERFIELFITGDPGDPAFRGMLDFQQLDKSKLTGSDGVIGLLFYVEPKPGLHIGRVVNQRNQGVSFVNPGYPIQ
ncbi:MAG: CvpA family protein [Planctomycetota bacterium]